MRNCVRNFISVYGSSTVQATHREVIRRLSQHGGPNPYTHVGEVLYGLKPSEAYLGRDKTDANWVQFSTDGGDEDELRIDSGGNTPNQLLNHIVWFYSKVDPEVILLNRYDHENGDYVGGSFKLVHRSKIRTYEEYQRIGAFVCTPEEKEKAELEGEAGNIITWEQLWDIEFEMVEQARNMMLKEFPLVNKYFSN